MKKVLLLVVLGSVNGLLFAQDNPVGEWTKNKVIIDGNAGEWDPPLKNYDSGTRLFFDFKNDSNNLYLCFQTRDELTEAKILRSGLKIILSNKINGKHRSTIEFPLSASVAAQGRDEIQPDPMESRRNRQISILSKDTLMELKGFATENGIISSRKTEGIRPAINWDSARTFTYEIAIPFKEMFGNRFELKDLSKEISLDVVINAITAGNHWRQGGGENGFSGRGEGRGGGRMGGGGYGGMRGGGNRMEGQEGGQSTEDRSALYQKTELKQKIALASHL